MAFEKSTSVAKEKWTANMIGDEGAKFVSEALKRNKALNELILRSLEAGQDKEASMENN